MTIPFHSFRPGHDGRVFFLPACSVGRVVSGFAAGAVHRRQQIGQRLPAGGRIGPACMQWGDASGRRAGCVPASVRDVRHADQRHDHGQEYEARVHGAQAEAAVFAFLRERVAELPAR
nr:hypothetical protein [Burkholderia gladioli]